MSEPETKPERKTWSKVDELEVWKYYGGIGGADKDRMIQIVTWLLGISGGIIGFYATGQLKEHLSTVLLISLGGLLSGLAAVTALMYGGYALWNWAIADQIATDYEWTVQKPDYDPFSQSKAHWTARIPLCLAGPRSKKIAPVFWIFFIVSLISLGLHVTLLVHAAPPWNK